jgi:hypothetical protein
MLDLGLGVTDIIKAHVAAERRYLGRLDAEIEETAQRVQTLGAQRVETVRVLRELEEELISRGVRQP